MNDIPNTNNEDSPLKFVRLSTGEDVLTEIVSVQENSKEHYIFINPLKIVYMVGERPGSLILSLIEWVFPRICSNQEFVIKPQDIITSCSPTEQMADYYYEALYRLDKSKDVVKLDEEHTNILEVEEDDSNNDNSKEESLLDEEIDYIKQAIETLTKNKRTLH